MKLKRSLLIATLWVTTFGLGGSIMVLAGFYLYLSPNLPSVESVRDYRLQTPLRIYTADNKLIGEFGEVRRKPIPFHEIPENIINALIATEDEDFYSHNGVSIRGILRAVKELVLTGRKGSGGSTLTMQVTRNTLLSLEQTFSRKFNEILLALRIEKELSKNQILELYVNLMFLGKRAHGIEAAAEVYYGKTVSELSLAQHAMLVGVFQAPSTKNPIRNPEKALKRRNHVLNRMRKLDYISEEEYQSAKNEPITAKYHSNQIEVYAPYVAEMARKKAMELYGTNAYNDGYKIYTTIDSALQQRAQEALTNGLLAYDQRHGYRGAEQTFAIEDAPELNAEGTSIEVSDDIIHRDYSNWQESLKQIPVYGGLQPAVVAHLGEQDVTVLLKDGSLAKIEWESGLSKARPYLTESSRGPSPKKASDIVELGDVIRVKQDAEEKWLFTQLPAAQAAIVALNPANGGIVSLVGGFDFRYSKYNRIIQAKRQPGSNFKPFIYTAALDNNLTAATVINDAPIVFEDKQLEATWRPVNDSRKFGGPTRLREALYRSKNLVSIRVLERIGINNAISSLEKFGFDGDSLPRDLSLALGSLSATPLEIATGYAVFANGGYRVDPFLIDRIENTEKDVLYQAYPDTVCLDCEEEEALTPEEDEPLIGDINSEETTEQPESEEVKEETEELAYEVEPDTDDFELSLPTKSALGLLQTKDFPHAERVLDEQVAFIIDSMLKDVVRRGTGYKAWKRFKRSDLGGKTGTTNGPIDAWFSGYQANMVATAWVGFDQNTPLGNREYGGTAALPIWMDFMELALADEPVHKRIQPPGVVSVRIDPDTGKRAKVGDPDAIFEIFRDELVPELGDTPEVDPWKSEETINEELF